jgi:hypothetical protein
MCLCRETYLRASGDPSAIRPSRIGHFQDRTITSMLAFAANCSQLD